MQLVKDLLTETLYIQTKDNYHPFNPKHWEYYHKGGILPTLLQQLKDDGLEILHVWNKWIFRSDKWELEIVWRDESDSYSEWPILFLYGEPGLEPSEEQKSESIFNFQKQQEQEKLQALKWEQERKDTELHLFQALESLIGGKVVEFVPPSSNEENHVRGYVVVENQQGQLIKFSSTHWMMNYEDAVDSISISLM